MPGTVRSGLRRASVVLLVLAVLAGLIGTPGGGWAVFVGSASEARTLWRVRPGWVALALTAFTAAALATGCAWASLFRTAGGRVSRREGSAIWLGTSLGRYIPGRIGEAVSLEALVRGQGESVARAFGVTRSLRAVLLWTGCLVGAALVGGSPGRTIVVVTLGTLVLHHAVASGVRVRCTGRLRAERTDTEPRPGRHPRIMAVATALLAWGLHGLGLWALLGGLIAHELPLSGAVGAHALACCFGYLLRGGKGDLVAREVALAGLLLIVAGLPLSTAVLLSLASRVVATTAELTAFAVSSGFALRVSPGLTTHRA